MIPGIPVLLGGLECGGQKKSSIDGRVQPSAIHWTARRGRRQHFWRAGRPRCSWGRPDSSGRVVSAEKQHG